MNINSININNKAASANKLAHIYRVESGKLLASLLLYCNDITLAEEAVQDAFEQALKHWIPSEGGLNQWPSNPSGWLYVTARRKLIDKIRAKQHQKKVVSLITLPELSFDPCESELDHPIPEERLRLIFTCCHPAIEQSACVALTLKTLCGLSVKEIARAFVTSESAMARRLTRTKRKIRDSGIAYKVPESEQLAMRLQAVLNVIYLIHNESHTAFDGKSLSKKDLAQEAIRLARLLYVLLPQPEVHGLLALLLLNDARSLARSNTKQSFVPLQEQNRELWDQSKIYEGITLLETSMLEKQPGFFQIQAAISALHCQAKEWESTDWKQINLLYNSLYKIQNTPIVALNRFIAIGNGGDNILAYKGILGLASALENYQPFHAAKADIQQKLGLVTLSSDSYTKAISMTKNNCLRDFLVVKRSLLQ